MRNWEVVHALNSLDFSYFENDLKSLGYVAMPTHTQLVSYICPCITGDKHLVKILIFASGSYQ